MSCNLCWMVGDSDIELEETDADEEDLTEVDGWSLLESADEVETKLDLARAYMDMEDAEGCEVKFLPRSFETAVISRNRRQPPCWRVLSSNLCLKFLRNQQGRFPIAPYRYALCIEYQGTNYRGWQIQKGVVSIQETLEKALSSVANEPVHVVCAGRTDACVNATYQIIHFESHAQAYTACLGDGYQHQTAGRYCR